MSVNRNKVSLRFYLLAQVAGERIGRDAGEVEGGGEGGGGEGGGEVKSGGESRRL